MLFKYLTFPISNKVVHLIITFLRVIEDLFTVSPEKKVKKWPFFTRRNSADNLEFFDISERKSSLGDYLDQVEKDKKENYKKVLEKKQNQFL